MKQDQRCSVAEMERMMKLQEVFLKAMAKKITWKRLAAGSEIAPHVTAVRRLLRIW